MHFKQSQQMLICDIYMNSLEEQRVYCVYKNQIDKWHLSIIKGSSSSDYLSHFQRQLLEATGTHITFDSRIVTFLNFLLIHSQYHQLKTEILLQIAEGLYTNRFISYRHLYSLQNLKNRTVIQKGNRFLKTAIQKEKQNQNQKEKRQQWLKQQWQLQMGMDLIIFWQLLLITDIKYPLLIELYDKVCANSCIKENKPIRQFYISLRTELNRIDEEIRFKIKEDNFVKSLKQKKIQISNIQKLKIIEKETSNIIKGFQNMRIDPKQIKKQDTSISSYLQEIDDSKNPFQISLTKKAYQHSLFYNPIHSKLINNLEVYIAYIKANFYLNQNYKLEIFGSLRSKLALSNEYDVDITFVSYKQKNIPREKQKQQLQFIKSRIVNYLNLSWISRTYVLSFDEIPLPVLKISHDERQFDETFSIENLSKTDVTIGNITAVINSKLLSHYSQIPQILLFCLLVKLWAKANNVINGSKPMEGLSGYGLIMMCLYYLMQSKQINFLQIDQKDRNNIEIGSIIPNLENCKFKGVAANFAGFIHFYQQNGRFYREKQAVCLLKNCIEARNVWSQKFIVNMYDFIDNTNPGRLDVKYKTPFFEQFKRAEEAIQSNSLKIIQELFQKKRRYRRTRDFQNL